MGRTKMLDLDEMLEELLADWEERRLAGAEPDVSELCRERPDLLPELLKRVEALKATDWLFEPSDDTTSANSNQTSEIPRLLGEYEILECLGAGGMGTVYKARHRKLEKLVALKVLPEVRLWDRQAVARFEREMRAVGKLEHPNLVSAHDAGAVDGIHYLAMQLIDGVDVGQLARQLGPLQTTDACEIARQAALGLQAAHEQGLVHRDVKPSNLMLGPEGAIKVLDLGLARLTNEANEASKTERISTSGKVMGTLDYMAPEQCDDCRTADPRADIYGLGATLYKLLCGQAPLESEQLATTFQKVRALAAGDIPSLRTRRPDLPSPLIEYVDRMLSKNPADRPDSAGEVAARLADFARSSDLRKLIRQANGATESSIETLTRANAAVAYSEKPPPTFKNRGYGRLLRWVTVGLLSLAALTALAATIAIQTDKGTLTITGDGVTVEQLQDAGVRLVHKQSRQTYNLKIGSQRQAFGEYLIEVKQKASGLEFSACEFTIARGTPQEVRVTFKPLPAPDEKLKAERWALIQELQKDGTVISVLPPDGMKRRIQSADEIPSIDVVQFGGAAAREENLSQLLELTSPKELVLAGTGAMSDRAIEAIGKQSKLTKLEFYSVPVTDRQLAKLTGLKRLTSLLLWESHITDTGFALLQNFPELEHLQLGESRVTGASLSALKPMAKLRFVSLHGCGLDDERLKLLKELPQVTQWAIGGRAAWTNAGLKELESLPHLEKLWIDKCRLDDKGLKSFTKLANLKQLHLQNTQVSRAGVIALMRALPTCEVIHNISDLPAKLSDLELLDERISDPIVRSLVGLPSEWTWTEPKPLGNGVNSGGEDQQPKLSDDGLRLWFQSNRDGKPAHELYFTQRAGVEEEFAPPELLPAPLNVADDSCPTLTADELEMIFVSDRVGTVGHYDLFATRRAATDQPWGEPVNLGPDINSQFMDFCPAVSGDGLILIFSSNGRGGNSPEHGTELFESRRDSRDAPFGKAVNLGATVNCPTADSGGWLSPDAKTLVFRSSRSRPKSDSQLYVTTRAALDQPFHKPLPLAPPFSSPTREDGFTMNADRSIAIIVSHRPGGLGYRDLWITRRVRKD